MPQNPQEDLMVPELPKNPLQPDHKGELLKLLNTVFNQHSTGPWMTDGDYDNPSADYLSKFTAGPMVNAKVDGDAIRGRLDGAMLREKLAMDQAQKKNSAKDAMKGPTQLGKKSAAPKEKEK